MKNPNSLSDFCAEKTSECLGNDRYQFTRAERKCKHSDEEHKQDRKTSEQKHAETSRSYEMSFSFQGNAAENACDGNRKKCN